MRVLVTGGAGFIGSHLVEALVAAGHRVRVLDNFSAGRVENLAAVRKDVEIIRGDCANLRVAQKAVRGVEAVYHQAAVPSVARSVQDPRASHRVNAEATLVMLMAAREAGIQRFIFAGSSSVYGDVPGARKREDSVLRPLSPYAIDKLASENYVTVFSRLYGMEGVTLRYFNVFGPRQDPSSPYSGVVSLFSTAVLAGQRPVIYGDGLQSRDFTYVANVVQANVKALRMRGLAGEVINVATSQRTTLKHLLAVITREVGLTIEPRFAAARAGDIRHSLADIGKAKRLLGYRPQIDFAEGIRRTLEWYRR
ncbi:MAG: SDR family oxidoreductase [Vicinamibacteria bacterium]|jgi:UDP-glucose 4-epimerase|nr:SDR family oxidoreductase [Vicinamibacteria bacterium]